MFRSLFVLSLVLFLVVATMVPALACDPSNDPSVGYNAEALRAGLVKTGAKGERTVTLELVRPTPSREPTMDMDPYDPVGTASIGN